MGFTLIELMIVVAVIGMLASVAVPGFIQAMQSSRVSSCLNNLRIIATAKNQAAMMDGLSDTDVPTTTQLSPYLKTVNASTGLPTEPTNGTYSINAVSVQPTCSVGGIHVIS